MRRTPASIAGGARALPSGERLAAAVLDFLILAVPQVIVGVIVLGKSLSRLANYLQAHPKATHLSSNPTYTALLNHFTSHFLIFIVVAEAITAVYLIAMYLRTGATVGKLAMGLRITRVDGSPMGPRDAALRSLPFWVPLLIPVIGSWLWLAEYVGGTLILLFRPDHRAPEDLLGRTMVVRKESQGTSLRELLQLAPPPVPPAQPPSPPPSRGGHLPGWGPSEQPPPAASTGSVSEERR